MKHLKMLGLAAVAAMALLVFAGVGSAPATVLCKTSMTTGCAAAGLDYGSGTLIEANLEEGTTAFIKSTDENTIYSYCSKSALGITTTSTGGSKANVTGGTTEKTPSFGSCSVTTDNLEGAAVEILHYEGTENLWVFNEGIRLQTVIGTTTCYYGATETVFGRLTGGEPATFDVNAVLLKRPESGLLCPSDVKWIANYTVATPSPLYVAAS